MAINVAFREDQEEKQTVELSWKRFVVFLQDKRTDQQKFHWTLKAQAVRVKLPEP